jgi:hypothetical protein
MADRKSFLTAFGAAGLALLADGRAEGQVAATPAPSSTPAKAASAAALAAAAAMRRFDPQLSDADVEKIAHAIDDNAKAGQSLNPKAHPLRNGDEPVLTFDPVAP